jgi:hypothetical protein
MQATAQSHHAAGDTPPSLSAMSSAAIRAFQKIAELWKLDADQQMTLLGKPARSTFFNWKKNPQSAKLSHDTLERISYILGIYKALQILLPDPKAADQWVKRANTAALFQGQSALERMLSGNVGDLFVVRQYLDAMRGGWA